MTTIQGELVPRTAGVTGNARRTQKIYEDILGRQFKTESYNWDGSTVYSTVVNSYNGRDQVVDSTQYAGNAITTNEHHVTMLTYDGHGRLQTQHLPQQDENANTSFEYNPDDTVSVRTDARGATSAMTYNSQGLVTEIENTMPTPSPTPAPSPVPPTPASPPPFDTTITFSYDSLGNRTSMTDSSGNTAYEYDSLSRLTGETRAFNDTLANAPLPENKFKLEYTYGLSGNLKSITDPYGQTIDYGYDDVGRLSSVTGSTFGGITDYADNAHYRAWGGLKGLDYGNGVSMSETFNNRLMPDHYELAKDSTEIMKKNYQYLSDGRLSYLQDQLNDKFDRLNIYDHLGRIKEAKTGLEARGGTVTADLDTNLPYRQSYEYNAFSNMTARNNLHWGVDNWHGNSNNLSYTYQNNRVTGTGWAYDAEGRATASPEENASSIYDARGLLTVYHTMPYSIWNTWEQSLIRRYYSGDGREVKRLKRNFHEDINQTEPPYGSWSDEDPIYYIRSSVLGGQVISEVDGTGRKTKTYVLAAGAKIATQSQYAYNNTTNQSVNWEHRDASGMSYRSTLNNGSAVYGDGSYDGAPAEADPIGGNMGTSTPYVEDQLIEPPPPSEDFPYLEIADDSPMYVNGQRVSCTLDGLSVGCGTAFGMLGHAADIDFQNTDPFLLGQLGISAIWRPSTGSPSNLPDTNEPDSNGVYHTNTEAQGGAWEYLFGNMSWAGYGGKFDTETVKKAVMTAQRLTDPKKNSKCDQALNTLSNGKISSLNALVSKYLDSNGNLNNLSDGSNRPTQFGTDSPNIPAFVENTGQANASTYLNSAFFVDLSMGSIQAQAIILIHEAVHQFAGLRDLDFNSAYDPAKIAAIKNQKKRAEKEKEAQTKGSQNITSAIIDKCFPALRALSTSLSNL